MAASSRILPSLLLSLSIAACGATAPKAASKPALTRRGGSGSGATVADAGPALPPLGKGDAQVGAEVGSDECEDLLVHDKSVSGDTTPFTVPPGETYGCFYFQSPFPGEVQGTGFGALVQNKSVLHHFLLYDIKSVHDDGEVQHCLGTHPDGAVISGWAIGGVDSHFPENIGFDIPWGPDGRFVLEVHYVNTTEKTEHDRSGVRVCVTHEKRPFTAALTWLGTENIGGATGIPPGQTTTVSGTCTPARMGYDASTVIHTLTVLPHMHSLGTRMQLLAHRANGTTDVIHESDFDYNTQRGYDMVSDIAKGDTVETRCTYDNTTDHPVPYGPTTAQEMCYAFVIAYPAGALDHTLPSFAGAMNTCFY